MASRWLERYRQASFRNVEFFIKSHTVNGGRRLAKHSFPNNDDTFYEDMGLKEKKFTVDAYIVADDYFEARNNLEDALNAKGSGQLVHPYRGTIEVYVDDFSLVETTDEGRVARFSISFVLASEETLTVETLWTSEQLLVKKTSLLDAIHKAFTDAYNAMSLAVNKLNALVEALDAIDSVLEDAKLLMQPYAEFQAIISNAKGKLIAIALDAEDLYKTFKDIIDFGTDTTQDVKPTSANAFAQFTSLLASLDRTESSTGLEQEEQIIALQNKISLASCASLLLSVEFASADDAQDALDAYIAKLDSVIEDPTTTDEEYIAFVELRTVLYNIIQQQAMQLAKLKTIVLVETTPSLTVSNSLYGSVSQEEELVQRNKVRHPAFVPGGVSLKVVTDV
jgi:prophage DNA circulation protein